ncbi:thyroid adenoma-associated protein homolog [Lates japonicus]|uniref:Thyroid adenoma-associated protein homolog n=1 Tax=Lates japonicus TaxID=270547 RepID=A0AAD3MW17_LATJO|nr:thyroid adenoma-associated protein homolog [Lates japonicus]
MCCEGGHNYLSEVTLHVSGQSHRVKKKTQSRGCGVGRGAEKLHKLLGQGPKGSAWSEEQLDGALLEACLHTLALVYTPLQAKNPTTSHRQESSVRPEPQRHLLSTSTPLGAPTRRSPATKPAHQSPQPPLHHHTNPSASDPTKDSYITEPPPKACWD